MNLFWFDNSLFFYNICFVVIIMLKQIERQIQLYHKLIRQEQIDNYKRKKREALLLQLQTNNQHQEPLMPPLILSPRLIHPHIPIIEQQHLVKVQEETKQNDVTIQAMIPQESCQDNETQSDKDMSVAIDYCNELIIKIGLDYNGQIDEHTWRLLGQEIIKIDIRVKDQGYAGEQWMRCLADCTRQHWDSQIHQALLKLLNSPYFLNFLMFYLEDSYLITQNSHAKILQMIHQGLTSQIDYYIEKACKVMLKIMKNYTKQHMTSFYQNSRPIVHSLLHLLDYKIQQNREYFLICHNFLHLLNASEEVLVEYSQSNLIPLCNKIIQRGQQHHIYCSLQILYIFSTCKHHQVRQRLIFDQENRHVQMWFTASITNRLHLHPSKIVRRSYFKLLSNVFEGIEDMGEFCDKLLRVEGEWSMLQMLREGLLLNGGENDIEYYIMVMINRLLFKQEGDKNGQLLKIVSQLQRIGLMGSVLDFQSHKSNLIRQVVGNIIEKVWILKQEKEDSI